MSEHSSEKKKIPDPMAWEETHDTLQVADEPSKQLRDVAFASVVLQSGQVGERQLLDATRDWTPYGSQSLSDHLAEEGLLSSEEKQKLERQADETLKMAITGPDAPTGTEGSTTLAHSPQGMEVLTRVAQMLGLGHNPQIPQGMGRRIASNRFTLIRVIGQGGLGTVWLARDEALQRMVAIKEINLQAGSSEAVRARFQREAEVTGQLEHPNIVTVYQIGEDVETGRAFYVMRFLGKKTLAEAILEYHERVESGLDATIDLHRLLTAFTSVCQAMAYAHSRGVIHRDLKPENIALDSFGQVTVLDWGLARTVEEGDLIEAPLPARSSAFSAAEKTVAGQVLGTPLYMAPEQAAGRIHEIDHRTDIYGLGAILFALLTGQAPHEESQSSLNSQNDVAELFTAIVKHPTPRARSLNPKVDPALDAICARAMAQKRYARYDNASELAEDVQRWTVGEPVEAYREPLSKRVSRWIQHHRRLSQFLALCVMLALVIGTTIAITVRQNAIAARAAQLEEMRYEGRQLELQLTSTARDLGENVRFMSTLPPIQGIIRARQNAAAEEGEEIWRERLETIYRGLLRASTDYLSVSYVGLEMNNGAKEIVRVERLPTDITFIRAVPVSRLSSYQDQGLIKEVAALPPGEVLYSLQSLVSENSRALRPHEKRLLGLVPVYDEGNGNSFGIVAIEMDLTRIITRLLDRAGRMTMDMTITGGDGQIWASRSHDGILERGNGNQSITARFPPLEPFFSTSAGRMATDRKTYVGLKTRLDPNDLKSTIGIILSLPKAE